MKPLFRTVPLVPVSSAEAPQRLAADAANPPISQQLCALRLKEIDRGLVPVEHRPLQPRPSLREAALGQFLQQRAAYAAPPMRGSNEKILEIKAAASPERREIQEPEGEADRVAVPFRYVAERLGLAGEQGVVDRGLIGCDLVGQPLVSRQFPHEVEDEPSFAGPRGTDLQAHFHSPRGRPR